MRSKLDFSLGFILGFILGFGFIQTAIAINIHNPNLNPTGHDLSAVQAAAYQRITNLI